MTTGPDAPESFPELKLDHRLFNDFSIVLPGREIMEAHDPELVKMIAGYLKRDKTASARISAHINSKWRSNITLVDVEYEEQKIGTGEREGPDLSFTPFKVIDALVEAFYGIPDQPMGDEETVMRISG